MTFTAKVLDLPSLPQGSRNHYASLLHERHWTAGHNSSKESTSVTDRAELLTCSLCASPDRREADTYDHFFRLCPHLLLLQCRNVCIEQLAQYHVTTDLEQRLLPMITQLVLSSEGHRTCLGNWNTAQWRHSQPSYFPRTLRKPYYGRAIRCFQITGQTV